MPGVAPSFIIFRPIITICVALTCTGGGPCVTSPDGDTVIFKAYIGPIAVIRKGISDLIP